MSKCRAVPGFRKWRRKTMPNGGRPECRRIGIAVWNPGGLATLEKRVVLFFFRHSRQRSVSRANQRLGRQAKDLFAHLSFGDVPRLIAAADRTGKNGVADDRHVRSV